MKSTQCLCLVLLERNRADKVKKIKGVGKGRCSLINYEGKKIPIDVYFLSDSKTKGFNNCKALMSCLHGKSIAL